MKDITLVSHNIHHVLSEPGDATRYDYFVYRDGPDNFCFMPRSNTFRYPQRLNYFEVIPLAKYKLVAEITDEDDRENLFALAARNQINPHTLIECINTIISLRG